MKGSGKGMRTTPVSIVESFFRTELRPENLPRFRELGWDQWIEFAKHYRATMETDLLPALAAHAGHGSANLYLEQRLRQDAGAALEREYGSTPLLGGRAIPGPQDVAPVVGTRLLGPLAKHLLWADRVVIPDNFYYSFDRLAEPIDVSLNDPNMSAYMHKTVDAIVDWLAILTELRPLITSGALVFMPAFLAPSFPYSGNSPVISTYREKLKLRPGPDQAHASSRATRPLMGQGLRDDLKDVERRTRDGELGPSKVYFNEEEVMGAWLNARILGLDAMLPTEEMAAYAARLYFDDGPDAGDVTGGLLSMAGLPLGDRESLSVEDLVSMRKNDRVFNEVKRVVAGCKEYVETLPIDTTQRQLTRECKEYFNDELQGGGLLSKVRILEETGPSILFRIAVGVAFLNAAPIVGLLAGAVLTPKVVRDLEAFFDPRRKAIARVQALL